MSLRARVEVLVSDDRRSSDRRDVGSESTVRAADAVPNDVEVVDLSRTGASFRSRVAFPIGTAISVGLAGTGAVTARIVRRDGEIHGCAFDQPISPAQEALAFGISSVVQFGEPDTAPLPQPAIVRWPPSARLVVLVTGAVAAWAVALLVARAVL